ncbi:MAG TPA: Hsp20/alpha crystallin family protein [Ktedonobacteraceae bacterium]
MRMRYRYVTYRYIDGSQKQLEQHYRQLLHDALRQSQQSMLDRSTAWRPPADILESAELFTIRVELAGMREEEIEVTLYEDALVISGERHNTQKSQENVYYHEAQIRYGPFRVEIFIPAPVKREAVTARYENGFLQVDLPRALEKKPESVSIQQTVMKE